MRKLIAAINMTLDGFCDHTSIPADEELHQHYTNLLHNSGTLIYGRTTYELMENYWPSVVEKPTGTKSMDDFALAIDGVPKVVFSRTLKDVKWKTAKVATRSLKEEVLELKRQPGKDIAAGSPSLIVQCMELGLVDEYQLCIHPVVAGSGLPLFKGIRDTHPLKLLKTKKFRAGAIAVYYEPVRK